MRNRKNKRIFAAMTALFLTGSFAIAQNTDALGTFTPYSLFGVGDINKAGTAMNKAMGGIGIGIRDNRLINILNPASFSEREPQSFMMDFGVDQKNIYNYSSTSKTAYNVFNMHHLVLSFPIYKKSAFAFGVTPYSSVGYKFVEKENDPETIEEFGDISYQRYGTGGINRAFLGASFNLFKDLNLGAEGIYYFGTIDRYSNILFNTNQTYRTINTGTDYVLSSISGKLGVQYKRDLKEDITFTAGATYLLGSKLSGDLTKYAYATNVSGYRDTVHHDINKDTQMEIPAEIGVGISFRKKDKWMVGADYTRQDWSNVKFAPTPGVGFAPSVSNTFKVGFEYIPNRYDIRYYSRRVTYRGGAYYENSYMSINGKQINSMGVTFGATLPIMRLYNGVGFSVDMGQRGSLKDNLIRERYVMFNISVSLHDIWFIKYRYD
jgi:hypothetical protein